MATQGTTIPVHFKIKYSNDIRHLAQQRVTRLRRTVRQDPDLMSGKWGYFDRLGAVQAQEIKGRNTRTQAVETPHFRRRIALRRFAIPQFIDPLDMQKYVSAGQMPGKYVEAAVGGLNRQWDDLIIASFFGPSYSIDEDDQPTVVNFPASNIVGVQGANLTVAKLIQARRILRQNEALNDEEADPNNQIYCVISAEEEAVLMSESELKSRDFREINEKPVLVDGKLKRFLDMEFIHSERLQLNASGHRKIPVYTRPAIGIRADMEISTDIGPRRDLNMTEQSYTQFMGDSTRVEEERIVQVECTVTPIP